MFDNGDSGDNSRNMMDYNDDENMRPSISLPRPKLPEEGQHGNVSSLNRCQTSDAERLCIYNVNLEKDITERIDIGGTYTQKSPEFWFFYTATMRPKSFLLLNLFVCHRRTGGFSIAVPKSSEFTKEDVFILTDSLTACYFRSTQNDETHYIKTFSFNLEKLKGLDDDHTTSIHIPMNIQVEPSFVVEKNVLNMIKLQHCQNNDVHKHASPDYTIRSDSGVEYATHKILLAAHSPVLRQLIKENKTLFVNTSDSTIELVLEFIYNGKINELRNRNISELLEIIHKFQLEPLLIFINHLIDKEISVNNAIEMAQVAKKYKLANIQHKVFNYIKNNPEVMNSTAWKRLDDAELAKDMFQFSLTHKVA